LESEKRIEMTREHETRKSGTDVRSPSVTIFTRRGEREILIFTVLSSDLIPLFHERLSFPRSRTQNQVLCSEEGGGCDRFCEILHIIYND